MCWYHPDASLHDKVYAMRRASDHRCLENSKCQNALQRNGTMLQFGKACVQWLTKNLFALLAVYVPQLKHYLLYDVCTSLVLVQYAYCSKGVMITVKLLLVCLIIVRLLLELNFITLRYHIAVSG